MSGPPELRAKDKPEWTVEKLGNQYGLTCPECGNKMTVNRRKWLKGAIPDYFDAWAKPIFATLRACSYCTMVFRIPDRLLPKSKN